MLEGLVINMNKHECFWGFFYISNLNACKVFACFVSSLSCLQLLSVSTEMGGVTWQAVRKKWYDFQHERNMIPV